MTVKGWTMSVRFMFPVSRLQNCMLTFQHCCIYTKQHLWEGSIVLSNVSHTFHVMFHQKLIYFVSNSHQIFGDMAYFNWKPCECYSYFSRWVCSLQHCQWQVCDLAVGLSMLSIFHAIHLTVYVNMTWPKFCQKLSLANTYSQFWEKTSLEMSLVWITWPF